MLIVVDNIGKEQKERTKVKESEPELERKGNVIFSCSVCFVCFRKTLAFYLQTFHGINLNNLFSLVGASEQRRGRRSFITSCGSPLSWVLI